MSDFEQKDFIEPNGYEKEEDTHSRNRKASGLCVEFAVFIVNRIFR